MQDLQSRNERMFLLTFLVVNMADTKRKLENDIFAAAGIAQKYNCRLTRLDYQQEAGLLSSVPIGENLIPIQRGLTTSSTAIFIPFITQELFQTGQALYYGLNALSNNMILCDRKQLKNPNGLILGTPGSGKSFAAKREMTNAFLITDDDIIICDPEAEYFSLVQRLNGQVIRLSPTGRGIDGKPQYVNPMDINLNYSEDDNPLALKSDFILSLCELVICGKEGLQPVDKTVIDRAVRNVYRPFLADPDPAKMPILGDLYDELLRQPEPEAARIAAALELYVSWYGFNSRVEWCACFVSWCYNQAGKSEPRFAGCEWQGVPWFQSRGQWGARGYENIAPGDAIFFDWDLDGVADHVGLVLGRDGSRVYTVEGNSGDACKIKSYDLNYQCIKGYGLPGMCYQYDRLHRQRTYPTTNGATGRTERKRRQSRYGACLSPLCPAWWRRSVLLL